MKNQVLSIEQMQKLKELGINTSKTSMIWFDGIGGIGRKLIIKCNNDNYDKCDIPTLTLQDLIELIPDEIFCDGICYDLVINKDCFKYCKDSKDIHEFCNMIHCSYDDNILMAAYRMLVWLAENKYIKTNK